MKIEMFFRKNFWFIPSFLLVVFLGRSEAAFSYPGCADLVAADFKDVVLVNTAKDPSLSEPVGMSIGKDGRVFFTERGTGVMKMIDLDGSIKKMGTFAVYNQNELGLRFVIPDPNFATNRWLFFMWAPTTPKVNRLSRVHVNPDWTLDMATVKTILDMPWSYEICCHQGGALAWDAFGNLFVSAGNNKTNSDQFSVTDERTFVSDNQAGSANTMDFRGKILRIKPIYFPDSASPTFGVGRTYSIPSGNLREFYTASGYYGAADQSKILPELYTMGHRNPYTINVDPYTGWLSWGDIGPDAGSVQADRGPAGNDEFNLVKAPGFMGWPYFVGANQAYVKWDYVNDKSLNVKWDVNSPMNTSPLNTGVQKLPPAHGAILPESKQPNFTPLLPQGGGTCAISGPVYRYDGSNPSTIKLPPHFNGKWIVGEFSKNWLKVASVDTGLTRVTDLQDFPTAIPGQNSMLGLQLGPDGALYYLNYAGWFNSSTSTKIGRLEYVGKCLPSTPVPVLPTAIQPPAVKRGMVMPLTSGNALTLPRGYSNVELYTLSGKRVFQGTIKTDAQERTIDLPANLKLGLLHARYLR